MRFMNIQHDGLDKSGVKDGKPVKFNATNISYRGEPLSKFLDTVVTVNPEYNSEMNQNSEMSIINDESSSCERAWSSKKTATEIQKVNDRISGILKYSGEAKVDTNEILDSRIDFQGILHTSLGDAIRDQIKDIYTKIDTEVIDKVNNGSNAYEDGRSRISSNAIVVEKYILSGTDTNTIDVPSLDGYILMSATNTEFERANFFVAGVANDTDVCHIFTNRVIKMNESIRIACLYVRVK